MTTLRDIFLWALEGLSSRPAGEDLDSRQERSSFVDSDSFSSLNASESGSASDSPPGNPRSPTSDAPDPIWMARRSHWEHVDRKAAFFRGALTRLPKFAFQRLRAVSVFRCTKAVLVTFIWLTAVERDFWATVTTVRHLLDRLDQRAWNLLDWKLPELQQLAKLAGVGETLLSACYAFAIQPYLFFGIADNWWCTVRTRHGS